MNIKSAISIPELSILLSIVRSPRTDSELKASRLARNKKTSNYLESMVEEKEPKSFLKKFGKWAPLIGGAWIVLNIVAPLALLRIPAVQKYLASLGDKLPFDIPGIG